MIFCFLKIKQPILQRENIILYPLFFFTIYLLRYINFLISLRCSGNGWTSKNSKMDSPNFLTFAKIYIKMIMNAWSDPK